MYHVSILESIHDLKLRSFLENQYLRIHASIGYLFDVVIKEINIEAEMYDIDDIDYSFIEINFGIVPRPEVVFLSTYRPVADLNLPLTTKIVRVSPSAKKPYVITKYSLHKLMSPTFHSLNTNTIISKTKVKVVLSCILKM